LSDVDTDETWVWEDGTTGTYRNWASAQPDNGTDEDCAAYDVTGTWVDALCTTGETYACIYCTSDLASAGQAMSDEYVTARSYYSFHTATPLAFNDAQADCVARGGNLASVYNAMEDEVVFDALGENGWIGLTDADADETWVWTCGCTGAQFDYRSWATDKPDNGTDEDCAAYDASGTWDDVVCTTENVYACKYSSVADA